MSDKITTLKPGEKISFSTPKPIDLLEKHQKTTPNSRPVTVKLGEEIYHKLRRASYDHQKTMQQIVSAAIELYITKLEKAK